MNNTNENRKEYQVCIVPPEQHYSSYKELLRDIEEYESRRAYFYQENPEFRPPIGKFEIVRSVGKTRLFPIAKDYGVLYRGQSDYFKPCLPTLYREDLSDCDLFVNRVKLIEFELMIDRFKITQHFTEKGWYVDYVGLAQHYGLKTDVLDFTSDLNIAMFFAMCDYDKELNKYKPKQEDKVYIGYMYVIPTLDDVKDKSSCPFYVFSEDINPIGLQPFARPGAQKGFSLHFKDKNDYIKGFLYSFNYTKQDSQEIFNKFDHGNSLWCDDSIVDLTRYINETKTFSYHAVSATVKRWGYQESINKWVSILKTNGYGIVKPKKLKWYCEDKEDDKKLRIKKIKEMIVQRSTIVEQYEFPTIDTNFLGSQIFRNYMYGCVDAPKGYNSGYKIMEETEQGIPIFGLEFDFMRQHIEPSPVDKKVHALWKESNQPVPQTRSFSIPAVFKSRKVVVF